MTEITVNGMTCTSCATHVKDALEKIPGVNAAVVSYPESRAQVMPVIFRWVMQQILYRLWRQTMTSVVLRCRFQ